MQTRPRATPYPLSVAPMMDWTDRHYRVFIRGITKRVLLYTEMITMHAVLNGDRDKLLGFSPVEKPLALQLGGDDPTRLAECARLAEAWGYDEVNLNVGCPSERVQSGSFGACLMLEPARVRDCIAAMREAVSLPVTVKHRIGVDARDSYDDLCAFVATVAQAGADRFTVHARKAWLKGLSPKENRTIPPLRYAEIYWLKETFPGLTVELNGGVRSLEEAKAHLTRVDGVMVGRAAYEDPFHLALADSELYGQKGPPPSRREVVMAMLPYIESRLQKGVYLSRITRHMLGLFAAQPGAKAWKRHLSENAHKPGAGVETVFEALSGAPDTVLDALPERIIPERSVVTGA